MFDPIYKTENCDALSDADREFLKAAELHDINGMRNAVAEGADINAVYPDCGLSALHIAVGLNDIALTCFLVEAFDPKFFADNFGRWPTLVAIQCNVGDDLHDYIYKAEERFIEQNPDSVPPIPPAPLAAAPA